MHILCLHPVITHAFYFWSYHFVMGSWKVHITFLSAYMGHCVAKCCKYEEIIFQALVSIKYICVMHRISISSCIYSVIDVEVLIHQTFHSSKHEIKSNTSAQEKGSIKSKSRA